MSLLRRKMPCTKHIPHKPLLSSQQVSIMSPNTVLVLFQGTESLLTLCICLFPLLERQLAHRSKSPSEVLRVRAYFFFEGDCVGWGWGDTQRHSSTRNTVLWTRFYFFPSSLDSFISPSSLGFSCHQPAPSLGAPAPTPSAYFRRSGSKTCAFCSFKETLSLPLPLLPRSLQKTFLDTPMTAKTLVSAPLRRSAAPCHPSVNYKAETDTFLTKYVISKRPTLTTGRINSSNETSWKVGRSFSIFYL